jgi:hypothetical protein
MKKQPMTLVIITSAVAVMLFFSSVFVFGVILASSWHSERLAETSYSEYVNAIAVDSQNGVHVVAASHHSPGSSLVYHRQVNGEWNETELLSVYAYFTDVSIAVDDHDCLHVCTGYGNSSLTYIANSGGVWREHSYALNQSYLSGRIVLDTSGTPSFLCSERHPPEDNESTNYKNLTSVVYLRFMEGQWSSSPVPIPFATQFAYVESFSIGSDDSLHALIAVWSNATGYDPPPFEYRLVYAMKNAGGEWYFSVLRYVTSPAGKPSLVLDGANMPHVSYFDTDQSGVVLKYAVRSTSGWNESVVDHLGLRWIATSSIALGPDGVPSICFSTNHNIKHFGDHRSCVLFASKVKGTWEVQRVTNPYETDEEGAEVSLALDSHGVANVCYGYENRIMYASNTPNPDDAKDALTRATLLTLPLALALVVATLVIRFKRIA